MALKAWPWPGLPSFPRPHFPGKPGKKAGKPGQARLFQAYRAFDRAPDARVTLCASLLTLSSTVSSDQNSQRTVIRVSRFNL